MAEQGNPYAAPSARVADAVLAQDEGAFVEGGQKVGAGRGWGWIKDGFGLFRDSPGTWVLIILALFVILAALSFVPFLNMVSSLLYPVFTGGLLLGCRALARGDELEFGYLFAGFREPFKPLILVGLLYLAGLLVLGLIAAMVLGVGVFLGTDTIDPATGPTSVLLVMLLMVGLAVPLVMAVWFAPLLVVFAGMLPFASMKLSFGACLANILPLTVYATILMALGFVALIPAALGLVILVPVVFASIYVSYRDIFVAGQEAPAAGTG